MRFATSTRPDGTIDVWVLLSDGTLDHYTTDSAHKPLTRDDPPGRWLAITEALYDGGKVKLRGVGGDRNIWEIAWQPGVDTAWEGPGKVLG